MTRLVFFIPVLLLVTCTRRGLDSVQLSWEGEKVVGISVPRMPCDDLKKFKVHVLGQRDISLLGEWAEKNGVYVFTPVVPFTRGLRYELLCDSVQQIEFDVPASTETPPELVAVYPALDTVPLNLLKMHFVFSKPMAEGRSASHIFLLHQGDTLQDTFLDLQPELWNEDGTILTLWLDPGRIKRGLIPNQSLGNPLVAGKHYELMVAAGWKARSGKELPLSFKKKMVATFRDEALIPVTAWSIHAPRAGTNDTLMIHFKESLDYLLALNSITIERDSKPVAGDIYAMEGVNGVSFVPREVWAEGVHELIVDAKLEDLCGNNLNHPFDRDLSRSDSEKQQRFIKRAFEIKKP